MQIPRLELLLSLLLLNCDWATPVLAQPARGELPRATIHVDAFGPFGHPIANPILHLYTPDRKEDFVKKISGSKIEDVPYGQYVLVAWARGEGVGEREVLVNTKDVWVRVGLPMPTGDRLWPGGNLAIRGIVKLVPKNVELWWARVDGMFLHVKKDAAISKDGTFSVGGLEMGKYLVQVFEGSEIRSIRSLEIDPKTTLTEVSITPTQ